MKQPGEPLTQDVSPVEKWNIGKCKKNYRCMEA